MGLSSGEAAGKIIRWDVVENLQKDGDHIKPVDQKKLDNLDGRKLYLVRTDKDNLQLVAMSRSQAVAAWFITGARVHLVSHDILKSLFNLTETVHNVKSSFSLFGDKIKFEPSQKVKESFGGEKRRANNEADSSEVRASDRLHKFPEERDDEIVEVHYTFFGEEGREEPQEVASEQIDSPQRRRFNTDQLEAVRKIDNELRAKEQAENSSLSGLAKQATNILSEKVTDVVDAAAPLANEAADAFKDAAAKVVAGVNGVFEFFRSSPSNNVAVPPVQREMAAGPIHQNLYLEGDNEAAPSKPKEATVQNHKQQVPVEQGRNRGVSFPPEVTVELPTFTNDMPDQTAKESDNRSKVAGEKYWESGVKGVELTARQLEVKNKVNNAKEKLGLIPTLDEVDNKKFFEELVSDQNEVVDAASLNRAFIAICIARSANPKNINNEFRAEETFLNLLKKIHEGYNPERDKVVRERDGLLAKMYKAGEKIKRLEGEIESLREAHGFHFSLAGNTNSMDPKALNALTEGERRVTEAKEEFKQFKKDFEKKNFMSSLL